MLPCDTRMLTRPDNATYPRFQLVHHALLADIIPGAWRPPLTDNDAGSRITGRVASSYTARFAVQRLRFPDVLCKRLPG